MLVFAGARASAEPVRFRFVGGPWSHSRHAGWHRFWGGPSIGFYFAPAPVYIVEGYPDESCYTGPDFWYSNPSFGLSLNFGDDGYRYRDDRGDFDGRAYRDRDHRGEWHGGVEGHYADRSDRRDGYDHSGYRHSDNFGHAGGYSRDESFGRGSSFGHGGAYGRDGASSHSGGYGRGENGGRGDRFGRSGGSDRGDRSDRGGRSEGDHRR
jgi:hypothetical protein